MFTGIVESLGIIENKVIERSNVHFFIKSSITHELKIDQSIAHNGVCLTVVEILEDIYKVTAVQETLLKTSLNSWNIGDVVNLERCLMVGNRIDGHMVQGHVDTVAIVKEIKNVSGSWMFYFTYPPENNHLLVPKGSICINGVSLTLVDVAKNEFSVTIIPYTFEHTNFSKLKQGDQVNIEFDILGKYMFSFFEKYLK